MMRTVPEAPRGWGPVPDLLRRGGGGAPEDKDMVPAAKPRRAEREFAKNSGRIFGERHQLPEGHGCGRRLVRWGA